MANIVNKQTVYSEGAGILLINQLLIITHSNASCIVEGQI